MADSDSPVPIGGLIAGKLRVEAVLGTGGMGVVVEATHLDLEQRVAVKFMRAEHADSSEAAARFLQEARAAVRLQSEHVARVFDVDRLPSGEPYMVMELLRGRDLGALLRSRGGGLPVHVAIDYILQACAAISEAHALGIIDRAKDAIDEDSKLGGGACAPHAVFANLDPFLAIVNPIHDATTVLQCFPHSEGTQS